MKKVIGFVTTILMITLLVTSCQKTGPDGPKGDTGPAGSPNVVYSAWFTPTPWVKDTIFNLYGFGYTKAAPLITQQVLDSGVVLTYGKLLGYNPIIWPVTQVSQLPITVSYKNSSAGVTNNDTWSALATAGNLRIRFVNDQNTYGSIAINHQFRYIIIPGGKAGTRLAERSYHEICEEYHIPE